MKEAHNLLMILIKSCKTNIVVFCALFGEVQEIVVTKVQSSVIPTFVYQICVKYEGKIPHSWAVVVAQLAER